VSLSAGERLAGVATLGHSRQRNMKKALESLLKSTLCDEKNTGER
jgi:hypothetical protein